MALSKLSRAPGSQGAPQRFAELLLAVNGLSGILQYTDEPLVSSDFIGNPHSSIIDGLSTMSMEDDLVKVVGWYDNEWGYSCRTADLAAFLVDSGL